MLIYIKDSPTFKQYSIFLNEVANLFRTEDFEIGQFSEELLNKIW